MIRQKWMQKKSVYNQIFNFNFKSKINLPEKKRNCLKSNVWWLLKSQEKKFNIMNYKDEILKKERIIISTS